MIPDQPQSFFASSEHIPPLSSRGYSRILMFILFIYKTRNFTKPINPRSTLHYLSLTEFEIILLIYKKGT